MTVVTALSEDDIEELLLSRLDRDKVLRDVSLFDGLGLLESLVSEVDDRDLSAVYDVNDEKVGILVTVTERVLSAVDDISEVVDGSTDVVEVAVAMKPLADAIPEAIEDSEFLNAVPDGDRIEDKVIWPDILCRALNDALFVYDGSGVFDRVESIDIDARADTLVVPH